MRIVGKILLFTVKCVVMIFVGVFLFLIRFALSWR